MLRDLFAILSALYPVKVLENDIIDVGVSELRIVTLLHPFQDLDIVIKLATFPDFFEERQN